MRKATTTLTTAIAIGLLAGSAVGVAAQTESDIIPPVEVTGTMVDGCSQTREEGDPTILPGTNDQYTCTATSSFSDERLSGRTTRINEVVWFEGNGLETAERLSAICADDPECEVPNLETVHSAMTIENDVGVWRQRPTVWFNLPGGCCTGPDGRVIVMDGEAGHEGLVAVLQVTVTAGEMDTTYYGFILDARQLNPAPENASTK